VRRFKYCRGRHFRFPFQKTVSQAAGRIEPDFRGIRTAAISGGNFPDAAETLRGFLELALNGSHKLMGETESGRNIEITTFEFLPVAKTVQLVVLHRATL